MNFFSYILLLLLVHCHSRNQVMKYSSKIKWHTNFFWCKEADETTPGQADQIWELLTQWHSFWLLFFLTSFSTFIFISHFALIFLPIKWQLLTLLEITEYVQYNNSMMCNWIKFVLFKTTEFSFIISAYKVQNLMPLYPPAFLSSHLQNTEWIFICAVNLNQKLCLFWLENWYNIIPMLEEIIIR